MNQFFELISEISVIYFNIPTYGGIINGVDAFPLVIFLIPFFLFFLRTIWVE